MSINIWKKLSIPFIALSLFHFTLMAQSSLIDLKINNTIDLKKAINLAYSKLDSPQEEDTAKFLSILKSALLLQDTTTFFILCDSLSFNYFASNNLQEEGIIFFKNLQEILPESRVGDINNNLGNLYNDLQFNIDALEYYFKSVKWYEKYQKHNATIPLGNIAMVYFKNENYEKALKYNLLALDYSLQLANRDDLLYNVIFDYYRIGAIYFKLKENERASDYYQKSLKAAREFNDKQLLLLALVEAIDFYNDTKANTICEGLIEEGDLILEKPKMKQSYFGEIFLFVKTKYFLNVGKIEKTLHPKDIQFDNLTLKKDILKYSADYYMKNNEADKAVKAYKDLVEENEKIERESNANRYVDIEGKYRNEELEKENLELVKDIKNRKRTTLIILGFLTLVCSLLILQFLNNLRHKKLNNLLKQKTTELESSNTDLANSNEELERFTFIASHDLKTPIRDIVSFTNLLEKRLGTNLDETASEYLFFIRKGGLRLDRLIQDTLEYTSLTQSNKENSKDNVDLNLAINKVEHKIANLIKERQVSIIKSEELPIVKANGSSIDTLFEKLIENGIKYNKSESPIIKIYSKKGKRFFSVFVEDNGIGLSEEYSNKVFTMFTRLHNQQEYTGTGLGLSICKKIIENLKGEIQLLSKEGEGSVFEIKFPNLLIAKKTIH